MAVFQPSLFPQLTGLPAPPPAPPVNYLRGLPTNPFPNATGAFMRSLPSPPAAPPVNFLNTLPSAQVPSGAAALAQDAVKAGTAPRFIPNAFAPSASGAAATGKFAFLRNGAGGLKPGLATAGAGIVAKGAGDYLRAQGNDSVGGALQGAGTLTSLAAIPAAIPGVAAAPVAGVAAAGGALGDIGASILANPIRNALGMEELANPHLSNLTDPGGALSWVPMIGGGAGPAAGPDLSAEGLKAKLDSFGFDPNTREQVKAQFNQYAADLRAQGVPLEQATQQAYTKFFEPTKDASGAVTQNALALQLRDEAAVTPPPEELQRQQLESIRMEAARAAAFQAMLSQVGEQVMGPNPSDANRQFFASLPALYGANQARIAEAQAAEQQANLNEQLTRERIRQMSSGGGTEDLAALLGE